MSSSLPPFAAELMERGTAAVTFLINTDGFSLIIQILTPGRRLYLCRQRYNGDSRFAPSSRLESSPVPPSTPLKGVCEAIRGLVLGALKANLDWLVWWRVFTCGAQMYARARRNTLPVCTVEREILASFLHTGWRRCRVVHRLYSHWFVHKPDCTNLRHFNSSPSVPPTIAETAVMSCSECYIFISRLLLVRISLTQTVVTHFINPISLKKNQKYQRGILHTNFSEEDQLFIITEQFICL